MTFTMTRVREITFSELCGFEEKQWQAAEAADRHRYTLFGGSRGPGKSYLLRWYALRRLLMWAERGLHNVNVMLGCEDYPSLKDRQISKIATEFPLWMGDLKETKTRGLGFHLHPEYGGGAILLRNLDDPSKYQSAEFAGILIDELTRNPLSTFNILRGSLRWPGIEDVFLVGATNPAPGWVRAYWIEHDFPEELKSEAHQFAFVPALPTDNPHLPASYWQMLNTLPDALRKAWVKGDWYISVEGLVYDAFGAENVVEDEPDPALPFEIAIDDGYIDPRATLFIQRKENGDVLVFDELYETKALEEQTIRHILQKCIELAGQAIPDGWEEMNLEQCQKWCMASGVTRPSLAVVSHEAVALRQRLRDAGISARNWLSKKVSGQGSTRMAAITLTRESICDGQGYRALRVHQRCRYLLDELQIGYKYPEGKHGLEAKPADGNDHAAQALESWVWLRMNHGGWARA